MEATTLFYKVTALRRECCRNFVDQQEKHVVSRGLVAFGIPPWNVSEVKAAHLAVSHHISHQVAADVARVSARSARLSHAFDTAGTS